MKGTGSLPFPNPSGSSVLGGESTQRVEHNISRRAWIEGPVRFRFIGTSQVRRHVAVIRLRLVGTAQVAAEGDFGTFDFEERTI